MKEIRWRLALILGLTALSVAALWPPAKRIHLGLDLKGGVQLVMQVNTGEALGRKLESDAESVRALLTDNSIPHAGVQRDGERIVVTGLDPEGRSRLGSLLGERMMEYRLEADGGTDAAVRLSADEATALRRAAVQQTLQTIRTRVDEYGIAEPEIQQQGIGPDADRIVVKLPGVENPDQVVEVFRRPAFLEWKLVSYPPGVSGENWRGLPSREAVLAAFGGTLPDDTEIREEVARTPDGTAERLYWPLRKAAPIKGNDLKSVVRGQGEFGQPVVDFTLTPRAGKVFEDLTRANIGRQVAILLDNMVLSAPSIRGVIADRGFIESNFTLESADVLVLQLKSGALPASLDILEQRSVGPSLGVDSIRQGVFAGLIGFGAVGLFMLIYYRLSGINAIVALLLNLIFLLGVMAYMKAALTLPGIAGLILTIGMAVDSNVLIFERIREELRIGKTVRGAVDAGFARAFSAILDANVTTMIAAAFLFQYGSGPIRGFAVTLFIGLCASMLTALFVSRTLFMAVIAGRPGRTSLSI